MGGLGGVEAAHDADATGGRRLGLVTLASTFSQASAVINTDYDVITNLAVTVGVRPILLRVFLPTCTHAVASAVLQIKLYEGATQLQSATQASPAVAGRGFQMVAEVPLSPSAGDHTYKATLRTTTDVGNISVISGATAPAYLMAVEQ